MYFLDGIYRSLGFIFCSHYQKLWLWCDDCWIAVLLLLLLFMLHVIGYWLRNCSSHCRPSLSPRRVSESRLFGRGYSTLYHVCPPIQTQGQYFVTSFETEFGWRKMFFHWLKLCQNDSQLLPFLMIYIWKQTSLEWDHVNDMLYSFVLVNLLIY